MAADIFLGHAVCSSNKKNNKIMKITFQKTPTVKGIVKKKRRDVE